METAMENAAQVTEIEYQLIESGKKMIGEANSMVITSQEEYSEAGRVLVEIKTRMKQVKDYWDAPKRRAKEAHSAICDREKAMLKPLTDAESIIKRTMVSYQAEVERKRREAEEEARRQKQIEIDRLLAETMKAEEEGKKQEAEVNLAMAQMIDDMKAPVMVEAPVANGTSVRKVWKARVVDPEKVPAYANGIEIREIKQSKLDSIAKMTNGTAKIDGVEFYQDSSLVVRT